MIQPLRNAYERDQAAMRIALHDARTGDLDSVLADLKEEDRKVRQLRYLASKL